MALSAIGRVAVVGSLPNDCIVALVTAVEIPAAGAAQVHLVHQGYAGLGGGDERASGTATLIVGNLAVTTAGPGMVTGRFVPVIIPGHGASFRPVTST